MSYKTKLVLAAGFVGAVAIAAAAFAQTGSSSPSQSQVAPKSGAKMRALGKRLVHSESKIQMPDGSFATLIIDHGQITNVSGDTVTIKRIDGQSVTVTGDDSTRVRRDGQQASFGDLKTGDQAFIAQLSQNGTTTVKGIRAFSPGFQPPARGRLRNRFRNQGNQDQGTQAPADASPAVFGV